MGKMHAEGVTLVELMVTLAVIATVLSIGIPTFTEFLRNNRMATATNDLVSAMHLARSEALTRRLPAVVCASTNANAAEPSCDGAADFGAGWLVFADANGNAQRDPGEPALNAHGPLPGDIVDNSTLRGAGTPVYVAFQVNGFRLDDLIATPVVTDLQLCDNRGDRDTGGGIAAGRWLRISATGHPRLYTQRALIQGVPGA
jgi:type IV fimbrial biogenesis protein FimT